MWVCVSIGLCVYMKNMLSFFVPDKSVPSKKERKKFGFSSILLFTWIYLFGFFLCLLFWLWAFLFISLSIFIIYSLVSIDDAVCYNRFNCWRKDPQDKSFFYNSNRNFALKMILVFRIRHKYNRKYTIWSRIL